MYCLCSSPSICASKCTQLNHVASANKLQILTLTRVAKFD